LASCAAAGIEVLVLMSAPQLAAISLGPWALTGTVIITVLQWALVPHLLAQRNKSPNATLAWLWAILLFPIVGGLAYFLMGSERVYRRRLRLVHDLESRAGPHGQPVPCQYLCRVPELERINGFSSTGGNQVELLIDGVMFFPELLKVIAGARHHLHIEFYIWDRDETGRTIRDALIQAASRGVEVRVLLDEIGSVSMVRSFFRRLEKAGGRFSWFHTFSPLRGRLHLNLRNHRKLVIADGIVALTGGMNVSNDYWKGGKKPPHRDLHLKVSGPVVTQLSEVFAEDWYFSSGEALLDPELYYPNPDTSGTVEMQVIPGGPDNDLNEIQLSVLAMLHHTKTRLRLMTPYFVPEDAVLCAIQLAAMRGVQIELMVPRRGDHFYLTHVTRSYYEDLLPHGVRIFEFQPSLLHAKVGIIDDHSAMCGSANLDVRSLRINFELNLAFHSPEVVASLNQLFEENLKDCREVTEASHAARPFHHKLLEVACRPLTSML
jgi:cardiolipin synthase A/B